MSWVRIEDGVPHHRKHLQAGPAACWLWVCGIAYCQRQLSDGVIPESALTLLGVGTDLRRNEHPSVLVRRLIRAGLFEKISGGWRVHHYHDFNDTREKALERKQLLRESRSVAGKAGAAARWQTDGKPIATPDSKPIAPSQSPTHPVSKKQPTVVGPAKEPPDPRVREFLQWFQAEYKTRRQGADYLVKWDKHGRLVKQMLGATDLDRLKKFAQILLNDKTDDAFIVSTDRGIEILSARFSWLSDRLAAWETRQRTVVI